MSSASRKLIQASGGAAGAADTGDDDFANVVLLLDGDGTSGDDNNTFTDSSANAHTITENGSVVQGSFSPHGDNWSNYFDYDAYINNVRNISSNPLGTQDFTIEFFFKVPEENSSYKSIYGEGYTVQIYYQGDTIKTWFSSSDNTGGYFINSLTPGGTVTPGQWHHFAVVRKSNTIFTAYLDGVGGTSQTSATAIGTAGYAATIGANALSISQYESSGYVSNFRMVIGTAVYTSDFTPPTSPLTAITNTEVLTCSSNAFKDESTNNHSLSPATTGTDLPKVTPFSPFKDNNARTLTTDGGSAYFGGSDQYLSIASSSDFNFGTSDFTIEGWFYAQSDSDDRGAIFELYASENDMLRVMINVGDVLEFRVQAGGSSSVNITTTGTWSYNTWHHFAVVNYNGTINCYLDGTSFGSTSSFTIPDFSSAQVLVGLDLYATDRWYTGYISDVRCIKGTALYTSSFTPPTSPLTAVTNTSLLCNFQDAGIYDRTGLNNLDTVGDAQIDTAVKKYGTGSLEFDGSGDYLDTVSTEALTFGTGDFTIEFWINTSSNGNIMNPSSATGSGYWGLLMQSGNLRWNNSYAVANLWEISASAIQDGSWHHVAISRASGSTKIFYDGTLQSTQADTTDYSGTGAWRIGSGNLAAFNGYLDDFRITKGVARYTANFTAPAAALPKF